jgi:predicted nucleotidyltransferase
VTKREITLELIQEVCRQDERVIFAYAYGSFTHGTSFRDIDIGIYIKETEENPFAITSDIKTGLSHNGRKKGLNFAADQFDVKILNEAPFTFLKRIFKEGILLVDRDPDLRTDLVEHVSLKYRECAGLLSEASL